MPAAVSTLWLAGRPGVGAVAAAALLDAFGTPEAVYAADRAALISACPLRKAQVDALCDKNLDEAERIVETCAKKDIRILTIADSAYPDRLRAIADPPLALYVRGRWPDFDVTLGITVVGTREATAYGIEIAEALGRALARAGFLTVSGMALGADGAAHRGALRAGGLTVAALAGGVDICYPPQNRALMGDILLAGAVISELPPGSEPKGTNYRARNRILSGLSVATVVVEAADFRSGALITARHALDQGRDVYAVPGMLGAKQSAACNELIERGEAALLTGPDALVRAYSGLLRVQPDERRVREAFFRQTDQWPVPAEKSAWDEIAARESAQRQAEPPVKRKSPPAKEPSSIEHLSADEQTLVTLIRQGASSPAEVMERCDLPAARVMALLTMLEMNGVIRREKGRLVP